MEPKPVAGAKLNDILVSGNLKGDLLVESAGDSGGFGSDEGARGGEENLGVEIDIFLAREDLERGGGGSSSLSSGWLPKGWGG